MYWRFAGSQHVMHIIKVSGREGYTKLGWRARKTTRTMGLFSCFRGASPVAVGGGSETSSRQVHQHNTDAATPNDSPVATYDSAKSCDAMWDKLPELKAQRPAAAAAVQAADGSRCELTFSDCPEAQS